MKVEDWLELTRFRIEYEWDEEEIKRAKKEFNKLIRKWTSKQSGEQKR